MKKTSLALTISLALGAGSAFADCGTLMATIDAAGGLEAKLKASVHPSGGPSNGGLDFNMWATVVSDDGTVCAVAKTGDDINDQWLGSRVISAQKANTANAFSIQAGLALSTANLFSAVQPGGSLFGLQHSNPVDTSFAYEGDSANFGAGTADPLVGAKVGGVNVFGGGLALYDENHNLLGAIGVSGDTSCADHNVAWRTRKALGLDHVPAGVGTNGDDNIVYDIAPTNPGKSGFESVQSAGGWGHPLCSEASRAIAEGFAKAGSGS